MRPWDDLPPGGGRGGGGGGWRRPTEPRGGLLPLPPPGMASRHPPGGGYPPGPPPQDEYHDQDHRLHNRSGGREGAAQQVRRVERGHSGELGGRDVGSVVATVSQFNGMVDWGGGGQVEP